MSVELEKNHFILELGEVNVIAGQCRSCKRFYFPYKETCDICMKKVEKLYASKGKLHSFTVVYSPAPGFEAPYMVGYIDMDNGLRVFGQIITENGGKPKMDSRVMVVRDPSSLAENENLNFKFMAMDEVTT